MEYVDIMGHSVPWVAYDKVIYLYLSGKHINEIVCRICRAAKITNDVVVDSLVREILEREGFLEHTTQRLMLTPGTRLTPPYDPKRSRTVALLAWEESVLKVREAERNLQRVEEEVKMMWQTSLGFFDDHRNSCNIMSSSNSSSLASNIEKEDTLDQKALEIELEAYEKVERAKVLQRLRTLALSD
ncbi:hypothetical protein UCRPC4_g03930 [Phaeomoniella chlamydospora]|uniref:Uncharacterized protein n=1 Tax=Phaeomoniella chlamydospora TaxID=158046 RepID=A0A0G2GBH6_PHACM|nr:hypothetical protein UCRPC4_g03930 [Phaeomoniella chlamydospora]